MLLIDLTHTSHSRARTGIQRVSRALRTELSGRGQACEITWDKYAREWRRLEDWEFDALEDGAPGARRGATWPALARWRGRLRRWWREAKGGAARANTAGARSGSTAGGIETAAIDPSASLLVPELFGADTAAALPTLRRRIKGPSVALFHDAIALQFPELSPPKTVARFPSYLLELARFDGIAAVSKDSREVLLDYWKWAGLRETPPVVAIPLGIDGPAKRARSVAPTGAAERVAEHTAAQASSATGAEGRSGTVEPVRVLCVGTIEGRKNHLALLEAAERLWAQGVGFELRLIGMAQTDTGGPALERIAQLRAAGRPLRYDGPVDEHTLTTAYDTCDFTVYPSLYEGFGLPVLESLRAGKPCVCSAQGALGESAAGGGCLALESVGTADLAVGLRSLIQEPERRAALIAEARARRFRTWSEYADDLMAWMDALPIRRSDTSVS